MDQAFCPAGVRTGIPMITRGKATCSLLGVTRAKRAAAAENSIETIAYEPDWPHTIEVGVRHAPASAPTRQLEELPR
jgi:hypothetical protein